jgi:hypothetical protein
VSRGQYDAPPNERALWLRIRNTIESQPGALSASASASSAARRAVAVRPRWWSQWMGRQWELTLPQLAAAVSVIIIAVALGTAFSLQQVKNSQQDAQTAGNMRAGATPGTKALTSDVDDRVRRQQVAIDYWYERVSARKRRWNPSLREAFERNLGVLDQAVEDSRQRLKDNPHDEISEEMLNAALNDKMELLKEFSDQ